MENGEEDMVAGFGSGWEGVEDCGEDGEGQAGAIGGGRLYGRREIVADLGEEDGEVGGLAD